MLRIDFINDGSHDGPLIRLLSDISNEMAAFYNCLVMLGTGDKNEVVISDLPVSKSKIRLVFKIEDTDAGLKTNGKSEYILGLPQKSYQQMAEKFNQLIHDLEGFIWLYESKKFYIVFTTDGYW